MISDRDLGPLVRNYDEAAGRKITEYMSADIVSVEEDADLREVIETLLEQRIGAVPVVDGDGKLTGIISYVDLLRTYAGELEPHVENAVRPPKKPKAKAKAKAKTKVRTKVVKKTKRVAKKKKRSR